MRSNNLIEVSSQSYIAFFAILYSSTHATIYLYMSSADLLLPANTMPRARTLLIYRRRAPDGWPDSRHSAGALLLLMLGITQYKGFSHECQKWRNVR